MFKYLNIAQKIYLKKFIRNVILKSALEYFRTFNFQRLLSGDYIGKSLKNGRLNINWKFSIKTHDFISEYRLEI